MCKGGEGHLLHKREVVKDGEGAEVVERKERNTEKECKTFLWLETAPPPPKVKQFSSVSAQQYDGNAITLQLYCISIIDRLLILFG